MQLSLEGLTVTPGLSTGNGHLCAILIQQCRAGLLCHGVPGRYQAKPYKLAAGSGAPDVAASADTCDGAAARALVADRLHWHHEH